ncbi:MAG: type II/IV secretion system protein [Deltaproteobacteria bacterium]|nr:type II/IV secretion system protein [Deltaproteobacteria bacterium]
MLRNQKFFYLALASAAMGVLRRHAVTIEDILNIPGQIEDTLPSTRFWIALAVVFVVISMIPFGASAKKQKTTPLSRGGFRKEALSLVSRHIEELTGEARPDVPLIIDYTMFQAIEAGASDIHFDPVREGFFIKFRIDGMVVDITHVPARLSKPISNRLKVLSNLVVYQGFLPQDGRLGTETDDSPRESKTPSDFRIAFMPTLHGERIVIRILGRSGGAADFAELGMNERQQEMMSRFASEPQGMIVLTGPTGSGKTTTIYAALRAIQDQSLGKRSISTLEDPIEYEVQGINQSQVNEKKDFSFHKGLRAILRQDPDVIMVGEIRDAETAGIAIQAGMTGHLIITTVHANSSAATFSRLIEMGVAPFSLNTAVTAIIAQRLVRRVCESCRYERPASFHEIEKLGVRNTPENFHIYEGKGCAGCDGTGYRDRHALYEILEVTESIRSLVGEGVSADTIYNTARKEGMSNLFDAGIEAIGKGITTPEEVIRVVFRERR